jgi:mycoredoxin
LEPQTIKIYGQSWCGDTNRARRVLDKKNIQYTWCDIGHDATGRDFVKKCNRGMECVPTIVFPDGSILVEPSDAELIKKLDSLK